jgi:hypothetical protein
MNSSCSSSLSSQLSEYNTLYFHDKKTWTRTIINLKINCSLKNDRNTLEQLKKYMRVMKKEIVDKVFEMRRIIKWMDEGRDIDDYYRMYGDDY